LDLIGQFLVAAQSMWFFDDKQNVSSSGQQDKQSSNCVVGQQRLVLGKVPACEVWLELTLVCHLTEPSICCNSAKMTRFLQTNATMGDESLEQSPIARLSSL